MMPPEKTGGIMALKTGQAASQVWRQHVEAFQKSGLTRPAYCRKHRIRVSQLDYWRRKLSSAGIGEEEAQWVPVTIAEEAAEADCGIQLWIGKLRIELHSGFDRRLLSEILLAVNGPC
jgi:hypothetical protein